MLAAVDFFSVEVWTKTGLLTYYVLTFMRVASQKVCIAGVTHSPDQRWMEQMARNMSFAESGFLNGCRYLLHDRDTKFCASFAAILEVVGIKTVKLAGAEPQFERAFGTVA